MKGLMHFGQNGLASCGLSKLLVLQVTTDVSAVDCAACLWAVLGECQRQIAIAVSQVDAIMLRAKVVTDEIANRKLGVVA